MANGGCYNFYWSNREAEARFAELVKALPRIESTYFKDGLECSDEIATEFLAHVDEVFKKIKRARNPKVLFSVGENVFEYKNTKMTDDLRVHILGKFPNAFIWNDLV